MKSLRFLPLTFFAGVHGFALFAPYLVLVVAASRLIGWTVRNRAASAMPRERNAPQAFPDAEAQLLSFATVAVAE